MTDPALRRRVRLTRAVLAWEGLWRALAPPFGLLALFAIPALLGGIGALPPAAHAALLAALAVGLAGLLWRGLRRWHWPEPDAAARRLEAAAGLRHAPLAVLTDLPAGANPADPLWRAHQARAATAAARLAVPWPHPGRAGADRYGLGGLLAVGLVAALVIAGGNGPARLRAALTWPRTPAAPGAVVTAWIAPPAYTARPPEILRPGHPAPPVPAGSVLRITIAGAATDVPPTLAGQRLPATRFGAHGLRARQVLTRGGVLSLGALGRWRLRVIAATKPRVVFTAPPGALPQDPRLTRFSWRTRDAYGVTALAVRLSLVARPGARPRRVILHLPRPRRSAAGAVQSGTASRDLTADPWAGLAVRARLVARNGAGLTGRSPAAEFVLPARPFRNPLARRLIALRQELSVNPTTRAAVAAALRALPGPAFGSAFGALLETRADAARLDAGAPRARVQASLWRVARTLEARARSPAARRLAAARRAADTAFRRAEADPSAANRAALSRALAALQRALAARAAALAARLAQAGLSPRQAQALARALAREAAALAAKARAGAAQNAMRRAGAALAALDRLADQLQDAPPALAAARHELAALRRAARVQAGLRQLVTGETRLLNRAHRRIQAAEVAATVPLPLAPSPGPPPGSAARARDRADQLGLRAQAGALRAHAGQGSVTAALTRARAAMREAAAALAANRDAGAEAAERRAVAALQQGGQALAKAMAAAGHGAAMALPGLGGLLPGATADPMARLGLPENPALRQTRAIETTLRRREADPDRPALERAYLRRLLRGH